MPYLCAKDLDTAQFVELTKNLSVSDDALLMAFSPAIARFVFYRFDPDFFTETEHGRIFSPEWELKWRRIDGRIRTVYLGNADPPDGLDDHSSELAGLEHDTGQIVLWGRRTDLEPEWVEQQVPKRFAYPISTETFSRGRVVLLVEQWKDSAGGIRFGRYTGIWEIPDEAEPFRVSAPEPVRDLPYSLEKITIKEFQCIRETSIEDLEDGNRWIFLLGRNGSGKTAFLKALTIGICGLRNAAGILDQQKPNCEISLSVWEDDIKETRKIFREEGSWSWSGKKRPAYFCAYGPSRLDIQGDRTTQELEKTDPETSLLDQRGNLSNIERWALKQWHENSTDAENRLNNTLNLLKKMLPNVSEILLEKDNLICIEEGYPSRMHEMASGNKSILAMVGDILIRLFEMQPGETEPEKLKGIVVIDEIDVHLHPVYQRRFPQMMTEAFPMVQFICSTHSPIPLLGAPEGSRLFLVERDEENGTVLRDPGIDVAHLHPNAILTSPLFNMQKIFSDQLKDYADLDPEDDYDHIVRRRKLEDAIKNTVKEPNVIPKEWLED